MDLDQSVQTSMHDLVFQRKTHPRQVGLDLGHNV